MDRTAQRGQMDGRFGSPSLPAGLRDKRGRYAMADVLREIVRVAVVVVTGLVILLPFGLFMGWAESFGPARETDCRGLVLVLAPLVLAFDLLTWRVFGHEPRYLSRPLLDVLGSVLALVGCYCWVFWVAGKAAAAIRSRRRSARRG